MSETLRRTGSTGEAGGIIAVGGKRYICAYTALTNISIGQPLAISIHASSAYSPTAIAPTESEYLRYIAVSPWGIDAAGWYYFQISGKCNALVTGNTSLTTGIPLTVTSAATSFTLDSTTGGALSASVAAVYEGAAYTTASAALKAVYLTGIPCQVAMTSPPTATSSLAGQTYKIGNKEYVCAYTAEVAVAAGTTLVLSYDNGTTLYNPTVITPTTLAVYQLPVVAPSGIAGAGWKWFQYRGKCKALCNGGTTDLALGDYLEFINGGDGLTVDHATIRSVNSIAVAEEAYTSATPALKDVYLIGDRVIIAGS